MVEALQNDFKPLGYTRLFSVTELSEVFHLSRATMANYLKSGQVRGKKIGAKWAVLREDMPFVDERQLSVKR